MSSLGDNNRIPLNTKTKLLRWLVVVFDHIQDPKILSQLYGVLFGHLKYESLRPWVCHLLFLSTAPTLVKTWRISYLKELYDKNRESQHLLALLKLYKDYAPELIPENYPPVRVTLFRNPDQEKTDLLSRFQENRYSSPSKSSNPNNYRLTSLSKRQKLISNVPQVQSRSVATDASSFSGVGIEDIRSNEEFVENVHCIRLPLQMGSAISGNEMLLKLLRYSPSLDSWNRLDTFLEMSLNDANTRNMNFLLDSVSSLGFQTKIIPTSVKDYVLNNLESWDKPQLTDSVLHILSSISPPHLKQLKRIFDHYNDIQLAIRFINFLTPLDSQSVTQLIDSYALKNVESLALQDAVLRYHTVTAAQMTPDLVFKYLSSHNPMVVSRTCGIALHSSSPLVIEKVKDTISKLPTSALFYKANLETIRTLQKDRFSIRPESQHSENEPVTPESLKKVKEAGGLDISFDKYRHRLISTLSSKGYKGLEEAHKRLLRS